MPRRASSAAAAPLPPPALVLVTGACGYGASHVVRRLLRPEASRGGAPAFAVRAGDLRVPARGDAAFVAGAEYVQLDVTDAAACARAAAGCRAVLHLAALVPYNLPAAHSRAALMRVNVEGTRNVVRACRAARVRSLVLASSTGVVFRGLDIAGGREGEAGGVEDGGLDAAALNDAYSESKALAERIVLRASLAGAGAGRGEGAEGEGVPRAPRAARAASSSAAAAGDDDALACVALRPNGIWGPGEQHHTPKLLLMARLGFAPLMAVAPAALTDFTHRDNLAHAFVLALAQLESAGPRARRRVAGRAYFVTDGWPVHTLEFFSPLLAMLGFAAPFPSLVLPRARAEALGLGTECRRLPRDQFAAAVAAAASAAAPAPAPALASAAPNLSLAATSGRSAGRRARGASAGGAADERLLPLREVAGSGAAARPASPSPLALAAAALADAGSGSGAAAASHGEEVGVGEVEGEGEEEVVFTSEPHLPLPAVVLYPAAALLEACSLLLRPLVSVEPVLTRADVRKVVGSNFSSSARAARELGYAPVTSPARGLREAAAHYRAAGFRGEVAAAGWVAWVLAPGGIALTGAISADAGGALAMMARALAAAGAPERLCAVPLLAAATRAIFLAAVAAHAVEACVALALALPRRRAAGLWAAQTLALGFPSLELLVLDCGLAGRAAAGADERERARARAWACAGVRAACFALFALLLLLCWAAVSAERSLGLDGAPRRA